MLRAMNRPPAVHCAHVVPHVDDEASGPSYSVPRLCQALAALGLRVELDCLAATAAPAGVALHVHPQWRHPRRFAVSPALAVALRRRAAEVEIVHNHSLWSMANVAAGWAVAGRRAKLVTSPRGTLSAWALAHSRTAKRLMWPLQRRALTHADLLHATSQAEYDEIRALGLRAPVAVVPNGIDIPPATSAPRAREVLFLSRIHPKKGIDVLLQAWQCLEAGHADWRLVIAGRGEPAHVAAAEALARQLGLRNVLFPGPLFGADKAAAYARAALFVLPTHSENFGMVVAEALAAGCPAIVSRGAPWQGLESTGSGWWIDLSVHGLAASLARAMAMDTAGLEAMGARGRAWMARDFGWEPAARRMAEAYEWLLRGGARPQHVEPG
jgi:glycosyltransferase involved in cell wall biosynthesis